MKPDDMLNDLLRCTLQVIGRLAIQPDKVREIVGASKQLRAYNLCNGTRSQKVIAKESGLDQGNFSRTSSRWVENGVAFWVGDNADKQLLHLYPLPKTVARRGRLSGLRRKRKK